MEDAFPIGTRVTAIESTNPTAMTARIFGHGVYDGRKPCPLLGGALNPRITLDDGRGVVWGCQCWWGPTDVVERRLKGMKIETVPVDAPSDEELDPDENAKET